MAVYFIQAGENGPVKIGRSRDVLGRVRTLQTAHPQPLSVLRVIDGDRTVERWLHDQFAPFHERGEWFRFVPDMLLLAPPAEQPTPCYQIQADSTRALVVDAVRAFLQKTGTSAREFGIDAVSDHKFLKRLESGAAITLKVIEKAEAFMAAELAKTPEQRAIDRQARREAERKDAA